MERLTGWKQIATYLRTSVRTVQRWERNEALPVHRHCHQNGCTSYAIPGEIDAWLARRRPRSAQPSSNDQRAQAMLHVIGQQDALINKLRLVIEDQRSLSSEMTRMIQNREPHRQSPLVASAVLTTSAANKN